MSFNWTNAYNRLLEIVEDKESGTYYSGSQFLNVCREFSYNLLSYNDFIKDRQRKEKSTTRRDFYKDILNDFDEVTRTKVYRRFIELFKEINPNNPKVKELENFMDTGSDLHIIVPTPTVNEEIWNSKKLQDYLEKIDKAVAEANYNYAITLCYTCLEGFFKAFVRLNIPSEKNLDDLNPLAKEVKTYILQSLKSNNENVPEQLINLITTITNALSNYRNRNSDSHFDSNAEKNLAKFSRDLVNSVVRYILSFCK